MAILQFERTASGSITIYDPIPMEEAREAVVATIAAHNMDCDYASDNFFEMKDATVPENINLKCFGGPFEVDLRRIEVLAPYGENTIGSIRYEAKQQCLFFANGMDIDTAITMASIAAVADNVEPLAMTKDSTQDHWEVQAPVGIPQSVLAACIAHYVPEARLARRNRNAKSG